MIYLLSAFSVFILFLCWPQFTDHSHLIIQFIFLPPDMDECLRTAARTGYVSDLYRLIRADGNALRRFEDVEFVDTPLHIAAEQGCIDFAMEIMNLKPLFARKLNQDGLSPMHLAIKKGHVEMALRFMEMDKDVVRVKGKSGKTPLHLVCRVGNRDGLLDRFLEVCPESIRDVTTKNRTALHIATKNKRLDVLQVLIRMLRKKDKDFYQEVVNRKDKHGNTALHIAASNNQPQMLRLLLDCKADKHATNQAGSTALDVAIGQSNRESISILRGCCIPRVSNFKYKIEKQIAKYLNKATSLIFSEMDNISSEDCNALLVILALLLTVTFQAALSPPGGVWQGESSSKSEEYDQSYRSVLGRSVLHPHEFLFFYVPTYVVFIVTFFLTLGLLKSFPDGFRTALEGLLAFLAICFHQSILTIAPDSTIMVMNFLSAIVFLLMVFLCITFEVSKLSVSIVGCWIYYLIWEPVRGMALTPIRRLTPTGSDVSEMVGSVILGLILFLFLFDNFWQGTLLAVGFGFLLTDIVGAFNVFYGLHITIGSWFFFNLCRFCIKRCTGSLFFF